MSTTGVVSDQFGFDLSTVALVGASLCALLLLWSWHRHPDQFNLRHLMMDSKTGRVSLRKLGQLSALCLSSWVLIHETRNGRLTEWLFAGYLAAWVGANLGGKWIDRSTTKEQ